MFRDFPKCSGILSTASKNNLPLTTENNGLKSLYRKNQIHGCIRVLMGGGGVPLTVDG